MFPPLKRFRIRYLPLALVRGASHVVVIIGMMMLSVEEVNLGFRAFSNCGMVA